MAHDVFISYSSKDKPVADAACAIIEAKGVRCWIAPRDIMPGADWGGAIIEAIGSAKIFILIYSQHANDSVQIRREVERAVGKGLHLIPVRLNDVPMSPSLEYFISSPHWLDAIDPPMEAHLQRLADTIRLVLDQTGDEPPGTSRFSEHARSVAVPPLRKRRRTSAAFLSIVAILLLAIGAAMYLRPQEPSLHEQILFAGSQGDWPQVAAMLPEVMAPERLPPIEQRRLSRSLAQFLIQANGSVAQLSDEDHASALEVLRLLIDHQCEEAESWVGGEVKRLAEDGNWSEAHTLLNVLASASILNASTLSVFGTPFIKASVDRLAASDVLELDPAEEAVLNRLKRSEAAQALSILELVRLFPHANDPGTVAELLQHADAASLHEQLRRRLTGNVTRLVIERLQSRVEEGDANLLPALEVLNKVFQEDPEATNVLQEFLKSALDAHHWQAALEILRSLHERRSFRNGFMDVACNALAAFEAAASEDALGAIRVPGRNANHFLLALADWNVSGAELWLVENHVEWNRNDSLGLRDDAILTVQRLREIVAGRPRSDSAPERKARARFLYAELSFHQAGTIDNLLERTPYYRAAAEYWDEAARSGCADSAARIVDQKQREESDFGDIHPLSWNGLEDVLRTPRHVRSQGRRLYGLSMTLVFTASPQTPLSDILEYVVQAFEAGYQLAGTVLEGNNGALTESQRQRFQRQLALQTVSSNQP